MRVYCVLLASTSVEDEAARTGTILIVRAIQQAGLTLQRQHRAYLQRKRKQDDADRRLERLGTNRLRNLQR